MAARASRSLSSAAALFSFDAVMTKLASSEFEVLLFNGGALCRINNVGGGGAAKQDLIERIVECPERGPSRCRMVILNAVLPDKKGAQGKGTLGPQI